MHDDRRASAHDRPRLRRRSSERRAFFPRSAATPSCASARCSSAARAPPATMSDGNEALRAQTAHAEDEADERKQAQAAPEGSRPRWRSDVEPSGSLSRTSDSMKPSTRPAHAFRGRTTLRGCSRLHTQMARPKGFEPLTPRFVVWCSIQLSYGRSSPAAPRPEAPARRTGVSVVYPLARLLAIDDISCLDRLARSVGCDKYRRS
jgi:hypothetical protein